MSKRDAAAAVEPRRGAKQFEMPALLERFESKYTIPYDLVEPISEFVAPYCSLDKYSERAPDLFYTINSLYFDTPEFHFLWQRLMKVEKRFNMRIRSYGEQPRPPFFLEIKLRRGDIIQKVRARVNTADLAELFETNGCGRLEEEDEKRMENRQLFCRVAQTYNARPVVLVQYMRKAYVSDIDQYGRVTFDLALRCMPRTGYDPIPVESEMIPCDGSGCFDPGTNVILELKCYTSFVPLWMVDLVKTFHLKRRSFSKYATSLRPVLNRYRNTGIFMREPVVSDDYCLED
ncbi:MAG: polyphosphate polymerase domain-containing protein [Chitinispirillaceae bacterium]|nr:polyphosphate polymerase domain-containing protein [Chitinispirillaceae bacterium]